MTSAWPHSRTCAPNWPGESVGSQRRRKRDLLEKLGQHIDQLTAAERDMAVAIAGSKGDCCGAAGKGAEAAAFDAHGHNQAEFDIPKIDEEGLALFIGG